MQREQDPEVTEVLSMIRLCQNLRTLPGSGGLLDQDAFHVYLFEQVLAADQEKQEMEDKRRNNGMSPTPRKRPRRG